MRGSRRNVIYKLADDVYIEWVSSVDGPGYAYTRAEIEEMFADEITEAEQALELARGALERLDANNHTMTYRGPETPESLVAFNRTGPKGGAIKFATMLELASRSIRERQAAE